MNNSRPLKIRLGLMVCMLLLIRPTALSEITIGIIGTDSSHSGRFAQIFNERNFGGHIPGARITTAFPGGSQDMPLSHDRVDRFSTELKEHYGVQLVESIEELVSRVDAIMILSVDGRVHLPQAKAVFPSGKPVFIDKPLGGNLRDALAIQKLAEDFDVPVFSTSNYRFASGVLELQDRIPDMGRLRGVVVHGPAMIEPLMPDLFYYGVHPAEILYTLMGTGCLSVSRLHTEDTDVVTGLWSHGRTSVLYGTRNGAKEFSATVFGTKQIEDRVFKNSLPELSRRILQFFRTRVSPVPLETTVEIMAYLEAADESKHRGGAPVTLTEIIAANQP